MSINQCKWQWVNFRHIAVYRRTERSSLLLEVRVGGHLARTNFHSEDPIELSHMLYTLDDSAINIASSCVFLLFLLLLLLEFTMHCVCLCLAGTSLACVVHNLRHRSAINANANPLSHITSNAARFDSYVCFYPFISKLLLINCP